MAAPLPRVGLGCFLLLSLVPRSEDSFSDEHWPEAGDALAVSFCL
ncbi:hypothetical protein BT93_F1325 [Corymbia citriodora subsp. variegata]|nr:hypothetical protein BT93_F1325 [Corymbia citriodora subsp. variegata]